MLKLIEKMDSLDTNQSVKSYALSISILLWKNKKKKLARRFHIIPTESLEQLEEDGKPVNTHNEPSTEEKVLQRQEIRFVQDMVATLPEKYRIPLYLYYSANMQISDIAKCMKLPEGTIKSRMRKAKALLKKKLESQGTRFPGSFIKTYTFAVPKFLFWPALQCQKEITSELKVQSSPVHHISESTMWMWTYPVHWHLTHCKSQ